MSIYGFRKKGSIIFDDSFSYAVRLQETGGLFDVEFNDILRIKIK